MEFEHISPGPFTTPLSFTLSTLEPSKYEPQEPSYNSPYTPIRTSTPISTDHPPLADTLSEISDISGDGRYNFNQTQAEMSMEPSMHYTATYQDQSSQSVDQDLFKHFTWPSYSQDDPSKAHLRLIGKSTSMTSNYSMANIRVHQNQIN